LFYWKIHGYYLSEQVCIARFVSELLMQSAGDVIRIFPAWPTGVDGKFTRLLAQGGFEVSAERVDDVIKNVSLTSTVGGPVEIANPWSNTSLKVVALKSGKTIPATRTNHGMKFETERGETYQLSPSTDG